MTLAICKLFAKGSDEMTTAVLEHEQVTRPLKDVFPMALADGTGSAKAKARVGRKEQEVAVALGFLIGCVTLMMTGFSVIIPVFPQRLQSLGLGVGTLALMEGAFGLGMFLFSTPMGTLSGRVGRKTILFVSLAGYIVTNLLLAFVNVPLLFVPIRFVEGALLAGVGPVAMSMIGDTVPMEKQGRWIGLMTTAQAVGIALGPGLGGSLYQALGFTAPFLLTAGIALVAALLAIFMVPETLPEQVRHQVQKRKGQRGTKGQQPKERRFSSLIGLVLPFLAIDFGMIFTYPFVFPQFPFFFEKMLHYSVAQYGMLFSVYGMALAVFPFILGRLSEKLSKRPLIVIGSLLFSALIVVALLAPSYPLLIAGAALAGLGSALVEPAMGSIYLAATSDENRGQIMGMRGSAISLAVMLGPLAQAAISPWSTPQMTFAMGVVISLAMAGMAFFLLKREK
jgi:MFS family permease